MCEGGLCVYFQAWYFITVKAEQLVFAHCVCKCAFVNEHPQVHAGVCVFVCYCVYLPVSSAALLPSMWCTCHFLPRLGSVCLCVRVCGCVVEADNKRALEMRIPSSIIPLWFQLWQVNEECGNTKLPSSPDSSPLVSDEFLLPITWRKFGLNLILQLLMLRTHLALDACSGMQ